VLAVVDWFGPTDYRLADAEQQLTAALLLGCPIALCPEKAALASPVSHVDGSDSPFLIQHGTADRVVPIAHSESLHGELLAAAVRSTLTRIDGAGHATIEFLAPENLARIDAFLDAELRAR
jgi:dipeptidyl aminopeptidase/acylaminoacyl peptidase